VGSTSLGIIPTGIRTPTNAFIAAQGAQADVIVR
jgi:hypothetical protein